MTSDKRDVVGRCPVCNTVLTVESRGGSGSGGGGGQVFAYCRGDGSQVSHAWGVGCAGVDGWGDDVGLAIGAAVHFFNVEYGDL